uniref:NADH-ubiquinone oxidoreductase chain 2 n=1 Tax=Macracanthorhynchus hirudinaceus TaxID=1032456 RepID=K0JA77_MACHR|nr:NADH dehydrogenase subunit 2 [Macracanthorhynchus hirudinaceus]CCA94502.2 NADH Dehydrogenase subunit 2 [Macracanthorhynchus hirudinaceus]
MVSSWFKWMAMLLYMVLIFGAFMGGSFIWAWVMMELSLMIGLSLMYFFDVKLGVLMEYYIYQSSSSLLMLLGWLGGQSAILMLAVFMKLGLFPFQAYMIKVIVELKGMMFLLVLLLQKFIPFYLVFMLIGWGWTVEWMMLMSVLFSVFLGCMGGLVVNTFSGLMAYSSLVHSSWMTLMLFMDSSVFIFYAGMYMLILLMVVFSWDIYSSNSLLSSLMVVVSGFPPLLGFIMKFKMMYVGVGLYSILFYIMMLMSVMSFIYYLRLMVNYMTESFVSVSSSPVVSSKVLISVLFLSLVGVLVV